MISGQSLFVEKELWDQKKEARITGNELLKIATLANLRSIPWLLKENYFKAKQNSFL